MKIEEKKPGALIVSGGITDPNQLLKEYEGLRKNGGILIVADRGMEAIRQTEKKTGVFCKPDWIVGDFDSVSQETLEYFLRIPGIQVERHRAEKDESDTELAFTIAAEAGYSHILLMGATGTRLDHVISNLHLLKDGRRRGMEVTILDPHNRIRLIEEPARFRKEDSPYPFISFVPLSETVTHMSLRGFRYPLTDYTLRIGVECGHCISNEIWEEEAEIVFERGMVLVIEAMD